MSTSHDEPSPQLLGGSDTDQAEDDSLLGVPLRQIFQVRALRGLGLVVVAGAILLWPDRSGRVLGVLVGLAAAVWAGTMVVELARDRSRRRFTTIVGIGVAAGMAAALLVDPDGSLTRSTQAVGVLLVASALVTIGLVVAKRHTVAWGVAKAVGLAVGGGMLIWFPNTLLIAATTIAAGIAIAIGLIEVFTPQTEAPADAAEPPTGHDAVSATRRSVMRWVQRRPPEAEEREDLQQKLFFEGDESPVRFARFVTLMLLASAIASLGVVTESTAVVIGAMLIAPLMVPLMGTAYGVTMGWLRRVRRAATVSLVGIGTAITTGAVIGAVLPGDIDVTTNPEILARIAPTPLDLAIAVAAGAAGAYALTRRDVSDSLPGVAVAISLVPPLGVVGLCWQQSEWSAGNGALLLFLTNATAILVVGGATFLLVGAAPLHRVSEHQERWATVIVSMVTLAAVVVVLLLLNGQSLAQQQLSTDEVDATVTAWADDHPDYQVLDTRVRTDDVIAVDLAGPDKPPDLEGLSENLRAAVGDDVTVEVTWILQDRETLAP